MAVNAVVEDGPFGHRVVHPTVLVSYCAMGTRPSIILVQCGRSPVPAAGDRDEGNLPFWGRTGYFMPPWKGFGSVFFLAGSGRQWAVIWAPWLLFGLVVVFLLVSLGPGGGEEEGRGRGGREGYSSVEP